MTLEPRFNLPPGLKWGDPVYVDNKLIGHTRPDGTRYTISVQGKDYAIAWAIDTREGNAWYRRTQTSGLPDSHQFKVQIGGVAYDGRPETEVTYDAPIKPTDVHRYTYSGAIDGHADENDNWITLATNDPEVVAAFDEGQAHGEMLTETIEKLIARGLQHRQIDIETNDPRMAEGQQSARVTLSALAEKFPAPRKQKGQDAIARAITDMLHERGELTTPAGPADRMLTSRGMNLHMPARPPSRGGRLINSETNEPILERAAERVRALHQAMDRADPSEAVSVEQFAHDVNAQARQMGYTGPDFTTEIAQFYKDAYQAGGGDEEAVRELFRSMDTAHFEQGHCDFCNDTDPVWEYPCEDFRMDTPTGEPYVSGGAWGACERCASLVDRNERVALVNRYLNTKPKPFRDLLRPWTTRLHNQFYRHRTGDKVHAKNYVGRVIDEADRKAGPGGQIQVLSADDLEAAESIGAGDIARRVRETGEVAMVTVDDQGRREIVAEGNTAVDSAIERRSLTERYRAHPLIERYMQHVKLGQRTQGLWRNTEAWMALAEKYVTTFTAAMTLGMPPSKDFPSLMYFDPHMIAAWPDDTRAHRSQAMGLYLARALHDSVPYLWTEKCDQMAAEPDLPEHHVTRGLTPHPAMFWSFETALGVPEARIDWMLILETARGYEVWCPQADDIKRDGTVMITGAVIPYGAKWPDTLANQPSGDLAQFLLKRLAFLNSKYVETPRMRPHRSLRRDVERNLKPHHEQPPDADYGAFVVHLRSPEPRPALHDFDGPMRDFKRQHCWWRRAHTRVIFRKTPNERAVYVSAALCGDTNLPLIRKTYVVDK